MIFLKEIAKELGTLIALKIKHTKGYDFGTDLTILQRFLFKKT